MRLQQRDWLVRIQTASPDVDDLAEAIEFKGLDISFKVEKSLHKEPNKCSLSVFNLSPETRRKVEKLNLYDPKKQKGASRPKGNWSGKAPKLPKVGRIRVEIEAGYTQNRWLIFRGDLRRGTSSWEDGTSKFDIEGEDGGSSILASRLRESFPAGTPVISAVRACLEALDLGDGNLGEIAPFLIRHKFSHGATFQGLASDALTQCVRRFGVTWSVQNGVVRFMGRRSTQVRGYLLNSDTGMIGRPSRDPSGKVKVTSLLNPALFPGNYIEVQCEEEQYGGSYQIYEIEYRGDTAGNDWYAEMLLTIA